MERRSGFKECPKCGLRNKPSATQCDFCGQNLGTSDDWQQHVLDLESLNRMELRKPVDDRTSKRIESTIIRKDAPASRNMEIKEAGNIGKVLKDLDEQPAKEEVRTNKDEMPHQAPSADRLTIKEASYVPPMKDDEEQTPVRERTTIADLLKEPSEDTDEKAPSIEEPPLPAVAEPAMTMLPSEGIVSEPSGSMVAENEQARIHQEVPNNKPEPEIPLEPEGPQTQIGPEEPSAPAEVTELIDEVVPAKEVTLEVMQPPTEVPSNGGVNGEDQEVVIPSSSSKGTIKLKLVEVERPKRPMVIVRSARSTRTTPLAVLALGSVLYLMVLALTAVGSLGTLAGLGGGAVSSLMIIYGAAVIYPSIRKNGGDEVFICPKCHEKVDEKSVKCPACGIEFAFEDQVSE
jgi:RNA polymerase subunit RPABC4/transcription elongation factor Spt4